MEPRRRDQLKSLKANPTQKRKRFRIVKLEERIAPAQGQGGKDHTKRPTACCQTIYIVGCSGPW